ncbi:hypothetical protein [Acetobacter ascendens]|uniref:Uncharacterized protein n=1 Tax=Acetobacter ascendens TaxID=481146 RepID=A0A1Y0V781_9PROT|nr:hypothetical protein [Acetobacter ascendens]ARW11749.1 hypothetical protein S101447_02711 [Acetobacter ascendens]
MDRSLIIDIDKSSWPKLGKLPAFPSNFHSGVTIDHINIPSMLLMIGYLTTPVASTGVSLSEFWAWVRYLPAITNHKDLRLTRSFFDLDAHQKTILSDDFGMGVPMLWLQSKLNLASIVDGRYFMQRIAASVSATQRRTAKRGPNKTPDFVACDTAGIWHVVECKGTQSGIEYSKKQLGKSGRILTGGIAQKHSIIFPASHTGQRLVAGLSIGVEQGEKSRLTIIDPEPEEPFAVATNQLYLADDAISRGVTAKALRMAGYEMTAEATAAPLGAEPSSRHYKTRSREDQRIAFVQTREQKVRAELELDRPTMLDNPIYCGRRHIIDLPRPVQVGEDEVTQVIISQGINRQIIEQLRNRPTYDEPLFGQAVGLDHRATVVKGDERTASLQIGDLLRSEIELI